MRELRRLAVHAVLLVAAGGFAYQQSLPEDPSEVPPKPGEVELWAHGPEDVTRVEFVDDRQKVVLERKSDDEGAFYRGQVEPVASPPPAEDPDADAGAPTPPPRPVEPATFVSVEKGEDIAKKLAPLRAKRLVGEVGPDREAAFGLDKTEGTLIVDVGGTRHEFVVGGPTPGASDRYVRYKKDNLVYVIDATVVRNMQGGGPLLAERQQHVFKMADVDAAQIQAGEASRSLVRGGTTGRRFWADAGSPDQTDETAGNWLGKLDNLRPLPNGFVDKLPDGAQRVVRVDYRDEGDTVGFTELYLARDGEDTYYLVTETLRMPAEVSKAVAAQVRDDLAVVLGTAPPEPTEAEATAAPTEESPLPEGHPPVPGAEGPTETPPAPKAPESPPEAPPKAPPAKGTPPPKAPPKGP